MLPTQISQSFSSEPTEQALKVLRDYLQKNNNDIGAEAFHQASVLEEQYGDWNLAGAAHQSCIELAPNNPIALLYAGHWLQLSGMHEGAAALYSLCQDTNPAFIGLNRNSGQTKNTITRSVQARQQLRQFLSDHHRSNVSKTKSMSVHDAVWLRTHDGALSLAKNYSPSLFWVKDLKQQAYHPQNSFDWSDTLLSAAKDIKQELWAFLSKDPNNDLVRPYLQGTPADYQNLSKLVNSKDWSAIDLFKDGKHEAEILEAFPKTFKALQDVPCYKLNKQPFEVFFSILKAGQIIAPHHGQSNHSLTVHLPVEIPGDGYLEVDGVKKSWQHDELLIFDDNFLHSATNNSNKDRIVLIFSIWHPDLNPDDQKAIQTAFKARADWLNNRWKMAKADFKKALNS